MLEEKLKITKLKKQLFISIIMMFIFISSFRASSHYNIMFALIFIGVLFLFPSKNFLELLQSKNYTLLLSIKTISKAYIEIGFLIIGVAFELFYTFILGQNPIILIPFALLLVELITTRFLELSYRNDSTRSKFFAAMNNIDLNVDITLWWKLKLYFNPRFNIKNLRRGYIKEKLNPLLPIIGLIIVITTIYNSNHLLTNLISVILAIFLLLQKPTRYIIDIIFRTYVKFDGICISEERNSNDDGPTTYYYRIIDFHNKREFILRTGNDKNVYISGDKVTVIHGAFSKVYVDHYKKA